jgi:hypothetical protein
VPQAKPPGAGRRIAAALRALTGRRPKEAAQALPEVAAEGPGEKAAQEAVEDPGAKVAPEVAAEGQGEKPAQEAAEREAAEDAPAAASGEEAAARIDAARARLRATIAAPDDDEEPPENEKRGP